MKKVLLLALAVITSTVCLQAQYSQSQSNKGPAPDQVEGCLKTVRGHYMVDDKNGNSVELSGAAGKLGKLVGHTVVVSGKPGTRTSDTTTQGAASSAVEIPVLYVKTVKDMGKDCQ